MLIVRGNKELSSVLDLLRDEAASLFQRVVQQRS